MAQGRQAQAIAVGVVVAVHVALLWTLMESGRRAPAHGESAPLRVRWILRERAAVPPVRPPAPTHSGPSSGRTVVPATARRDPPRARPEPPGSGEAPESPARVDYLSQGAEWVRAQAGAVEFEPGPLASRHADLPGGHADERIRMRDPVTPAKVVGVIGMLFGDPGDPCPRMRRNVDDHLVDTSPEGRRRLEWELREYRKHCRP